MNGIFYVATGDRYREEAVRSVKSLKKYLPGIHTTLFSDKPCGAEYFNRNIILPHPKFSFQDKVESFLLVDYEKAVFLDTDTHVTGDISDLFLLLDSFDFAAAIEAARGYWYEEWSLPDSFPELNSGVVAFRNSAATKKLFSDWLVYFLESTVWQGRIAWIKNKPWDQPGLRRALYLAEGIRMMVLPTEYNALRFDGTYLWGRAKIVHGRGNIESAAARMNRTPNVERSYFQGLGVIANFSKIPVTQIMETVFRVCIYAFLEVLKRAVMATRFFSGGK